MLKPKKLPSTGYRVEVGHVELGATYATFQVKVTPDFQELAMTLEIAKNTPQILRHAAKQLELDAADIQKAIDARKNAKRTRKKAPSVKA